jgi:long-chain fatty acid transport protein
MKRRHARSALCAAALLSTVVCELDAHAAGLYFSDRGVRPLGRGGAFVAGADDGGAVWYNPAGLADAGTSFLFDASWLNFTSEFTRQSIATTSAGVATTYQFPTVKGTSPILPIPTVVGTYNFGDKKQYTVAFGIFAPYTAITSYPLTITDAAGNPQPSPSRYSLVSLDGSLLVVAGAWFAYKPVKEFQIGVGLEALVGNFNSSVVFSACPQDNLICAAEDPKYDAFSQLKVGPIFAPSGNGGITVTPEKHVRIAISGQLPFSVNAPAQVNVRLPNAVEFDNAAQNGTDAHVKFDLPGIFRAGIEARPIEKLRVEVAYVREFWTIHHSIDIVPDNITLTGITGFPSPYAVSPISINRNFQNSNSIRLGGEYSFPVSDYLLDARVGINYETSAIPEANLSVLTVDMNKVTASIGGGIHIGKSWRFDAVYAHVFASSVTVTPQEAAESRINPVQGNPVSSPTAVNGGTYSATADVLGVGLNYKF